MDNIGMERVGNRLVYSASDLVDFVACRHLSVLEALVADSLEQRPAPSAEDQLVFAAGRAHEADYLAALSDGRRSIVDIPSGPGFERRREAAARTMEAMRAGAAIVHGATFVSDGDVDGTWIGITDFLMRVPGRSAFGDWHYEVADTKLARHAKASTLIQLCVYDDLLANAQGALPEHMHAVLGDASVVSYACEDFRSYYRRLKRHFLERDVQVTPYPEPVAQCARCRWSERCEERRRADDYLSLVAGMRRSQIVRLATSGIETLAQLAAAGDERRPRRMETATFQKLRAQARLQARFRSAPTDMTWELVAPALANETEDGEPAKARGFALLPPPDDGDLYFDMEGDPFGGPHGLEYLFGVSFLDDFDLSFQGFWGHDAAHERAAFEAFVDFVVERRARFPNMHVYHYAAYEPSALKRLAAQHGTREDEVDIFLRERVLVDLLNVVRQSIRAPFESYSLKSIERFYSPPRAEDVKDAMGSVVEYNRYRETGDPAILERIEAYNRRDCDSTRELHEWLLARRLDAIEVFGDIPWREIGIEDEKKKPPAPDPERDRVVAALLAPFTGRDPANDEERVRALVVDLIGYHRREAKPDWWEYFARIERSVEELVDDTNAIGGLERTDDPAVAEAKSLVMRFRYPHQDHKLHAGVKVLDPDGRSITIVALDDDLRTVDLKRSKTVWDSGSYPRAIFTGKPIGDDLLRGALVRFGATYAADAARTSFRALGDIVRREVPRLKDRVPGTPLDDGRGDADALTALALALDESYLFVQGPPGSGKTRTGAQTIVNLMKSGLRVGVMAKSHKAIHNLLECVEEAAHAQSYTFRGVKRQSSGDESAYASKRGFIESSTDLADACDPGMRLVAGTAWLFARAELAGCMDVLVIDEAGQVSLADAIAGGTAARNIVLLGDPMQLPHVSRGTHSAAADRSVLEHLLGDSATVEPSRGVFLRFSHRMHPAICRFVSTLAYDGRLESASACAAQEIDISDGAAASPLAGAGLRYIPVVHAGNVQQSIEEAEAVVDAVRALLCGRVTRDGVGRRMEASDILVVTPYNMQVRRLTQTLKVHGLTGVRAGTVDKFQGQEAAAVIFSMASSSGAEVPRGIEFLFDRNRLNVAISRARALAVLVCSPALLDTACTKPEQLRDVNMLCRFVEEAVRVELHSEAGGGADLLDGLGEVG